jgi:hypothetical protein
MAAVTIVVLVMVVALILQPVGWAMTRDLLANSGESLPELQW